MEHGHLNPTAFVTTIDPCYIKELPISGSAGIFNYVSVINYLLAHDRPADAVLEAPTSWKIVCSEDVK